ncbi:HPr kinase/phosphorylase [Citreimonas salinaria]|uniref:Hpr(Ser) kinase/phosphatase n=1 Tax=Citreimonas salinaria TaxID=321339 RepID=A0A1H3HQQ2_9RHOB|nr:HPr kinase/phosphatase C-terminal domain-containing protein [Citreimonas salinaria]SDY16999.1 Hpr(Ser) kinase/phosphatase [Citreimonas salinaria]
MADAQPAILHASAVALKGRGLLIRGASGSGKSGLALQLMALGASLVADDRVVVTRDGAQVRLGAPDTIRGRIEARGVGILHADTARDAALAAVVDLDTVESDRLPPHRVTDILGVAVALIHNCAHPSFPAALRQYLIAGRET